MDKQQMEVKNFLMKAYYMDQRIDSKLEQMASLNELARKATSAVSDMPGSPNRNIHKTEDIIVKILELQEEIQSDISELLDLKQSIRRCGRQLEEPEEQVILEERYLKMMKWEQIAVILNMSTRKVFRIHDEMLKKSQFLKSGSKCYGMAVSSCDIVRMRKAE